MAFCSFLYHKWKLRRLSDDQEADRGWCLTLSPAEQEKGKWKSFSRVQLSDPMKHMVHGVLQARILEWEAIPFSKGSSQPRDRAQVPHIVGGFFTTWATREGRELGCHRISSVVFSQGDCVPQGRLAMPGDTPGAPVGEEVLSLSSGWSQGGCSPFYGS